MGISGKSDFQDWCEMHNTPEEILEKYKVYAYGNDIVPLRMESKKELVAYYPYLVTMMFSNKEDGGHIHLSQRSFIDIEEEERLDYKIKDLKKYYNKCKRKKEKFDKNKALERILFLGEPEPYEIELVNRVAELGDKATFENLHDSFHDRMRDEWYQLMLDNGWNKWTAYRWVYGWHRWALKMNEQKNIDKE